MPTPDQPPSPLSLRQQAESALAERERLSGGPLLAESDRPRLIHELQVHQLELELQNTALRQAQTELEASRASLVQSEKMAAIGILAAGVAHEINNPLSFISSNLSTLKDYLQDIGAFLDACEQHESACPVRQGALASTLNDFAAMRADLPSLLAETQTGIRRIKMIVADLLSFSRTDDRSEWQRMDVHECIDRAVRLTEPELKYRCTVNKVYGALPPLTCKAHQLEQVFVNLLINAAQAAKSESVVTIATGIADDGLWIEVADTGSGISPTDLPHVFQPFFTTKPPGKGTGLGLAVSYGIIQRHHGEISVTSPPGQGARFHIRLPLEQPTA